MLCDIVCFYTVLVQKNPYTFINTYILYKLDKTNQQWADFDHMQVQQLQVMKHQGMIQNPKIISEHWVHS